MDVHAHTGNTCQLVLRGRDSVKWPSMQVGELLTRSCQKCDPRTFFLAESHTLSLLDLQVAGCSKRAVHA